MTLYPEFQRLLLEQNIQTAQVLGTAIAMRDHGTGAHNLRVTLYAGVLGEALGLEAETLRNLLAGALLHDVGKVGIPDHILLKPGKLSAEEMAVMRRHSDLGAALLEELPAFHGAIPVVRHHHERYDGTGYPTGLAGEQIPLIARAFALADVFDALVSERPYKQAFSVTTAVSHLKAGIGSHFDPDLTGVFGELAPTLVQRYGCLSEDDLKPHVAEMRLLHFGA